VQADCTGNYFGYGRSWDNGQTNKECDDSNYLIHTSTVNTPEACQAECETSANAATGCKYIVFSGTTCQKYSQCNLKDTAGKTVYTMSNSAAMSWLPRVWVTRAITAETCVKYRAACGRCMLDAVATSNTVLVTGTSGTDTYQDMSSIPGFEIGF